MAEESSKKPQESEKFQKKRLEVETPEEARAVQTDTSEKISDIVGKSSEEILDSSLEDIEDEEGGSFFQKFVKILRMAGIGKKAFFSCFVVILLGAGIILFFSSGGNFSNISGTVQKVFSKIRSTFSRETGEDIQGEEKPPVQTVFTPVHLGLETAFSAGVHKGLKSRISSVYMSPSLQNAYRFGFLNIPSEVLSGTEDIFDIAYYYGYRGPPSDRFAQYIFVLGAIQSALNTDVLALLDQTGNRSGVLENHIRELDQLLFTAQQMSSFIGQEMATFKGQFDSLKDLKRQAEKDFFLSVDVFEGSSARDDLEGFIKHGQDMVDLKARNLALNKAQTLYKSALRKLDANIRDLKANREALIKGVQVVDIQNSDLNIILQEEQQLE